MLKTLTFASAAMAALLAAMPAAADWRKEVPVLRVGILSGENEADRLRRLSCLKDKLETRLGIPVELYPATDYAGVMQGLLAKQLDVAGLGPVGYAGIVLQDPEAVEPILTNANVDGSLGYYSVLVTRADSGLTKLEDLKGKSLAWADPNSASGFLYPKADLEKQGINIEQFFGRVGFSGGHEQGVIAVLDKTYDVAATWISGMGDPAQGFSRGNLRRMVDKGMVKMSDLNLVWRSDLIPNGPTVLRTGVPSELRDMLVGIYTRMHLDDPECYKNVAGGEGNGYVPVTRAFYDSTVELRRREVQGSR
jgi:phosphonate transport system substrate-binding protein